MDIKAAAVNPLKRACDIFLQDLQALPDDAFCTRLGGKARTVADIVHEVNLVNDLLGREMRGDEPFPWPEGGWVTAPGELCTKALVIEAFESTAQNLVATADSFTADQLDEPLAIEDGETTRFERCRFATLHLWYHSGQLNFIQTLLGDDKWNWK